MGLCLGFIHQNKIIEQLLCASAVLSASHALLIHLWPRVEMPLSSCCGWENRFADVEWVAQSHTFCKWRSWSSDVGLRSQSSALNHASLDWSRAVQEEGSSACSSGGANQHFHLWAVWPRVSHFISLCFSFLICSMGTDDIIFLMGLLWRWNHVPGSG